MGFFDKVRETLRDKSRDYLCASLQSMGVNAQMAERGRAEENIECGVYSKSLGLIDIPEGPIRWVNVVKRAENAPGGSARYEKYGVPDRRLKSNSPEVEIESKRKRDNWQWKGKDAGLGIIDRLNGDISTGYALLRIKSPKVTIRAYTDPSCWVISSEMPSALSQELWNCYQAIARHLLAEWSPG